MAAKIKKTEKKEDVTVTEDQIREEWETAIKGIETLLEAQVAKCQRVDYLFELKHFWCTVNKDINCPGPSYFYEVTNLCTATYEKMIDIVDNMKFEDFTTELPRDLLTGPLMSADDCKTWTEAYEEIMVWECLRPYGEKLEQLCSIVMNEMSQISKED